MPVTVNSLAPPSLVLIYGKRQIGIARPLDIERLKRRAAGLFGIADSPLNEDGKACELRIYYYTPKSIAVPGNETPVKHARKRVKSEEASLHTMESDSEEEEAVESGQGNKRKRADGKQDPYPDASCLKRELGSCLLAKLPDDFELHVELVCIEKTPENREKKALPKKGVNQAQALEIDELDELDEEEGDDGASSDCVAIRYDSGKQGTEGISSATLVNSGSGAKKTKSSFPYTLSEYDTAEREEGDGSSACSCDVCQRERTEWAKINIVAPGRTTTEINKVQDGLPLTKANLEKAATASLAASIEKAAYEDPARLDMQEYGIYDDGLRRCIDCFAEIVEGECCSCGRAYEPTKENANFERAACPSCGYEVVKTFGEPEYACIRADCEWTCGAKGASDYSDVTKREESEEGESGPTACEIHGDGDLCTCACAKNDAHCEDHPYGHDLEINYGSEPSVPTPPPSTLDESEMDNELQVAGIDEGMAEEEEPVIVPNSPATLETTSLLSTPPRDRLATLAGISSGGGANPILVSSQEV